MEFIWLEDFLALVDSGSFSRTAELRHVTQPAFSRRIRALERWVGVNLFERNRHPVFPRSCSDQHGSMVRRFDTVRNSGLH
jgi:DNA-binding transcriptional LysR family regulator